MTNTKIIREALEAVEHNASAGSAWNKGRTDSSPRDCHNYFAKIIQIARRARAALNKEDE